MKSTKAQAIFAIALAAGLGLITAESANARGGGGGGHYMGGGTSSGFSGSGFVTGSAAGARGFGGRYNGFDNWGGYGYGGYGWGGYGGFGNYETWGPSSAYEAEQSINANPDRPSAFSRGYGGNATVSPAVDQTWNTPSTSQQALAMEGAFGRAATTSGSGAYGHYTAASSQQQMMNMGSSVRGAFKQYDMFGKNWFLSHKGSWNNPTWSDDWAWGNTGWSSIAGWWGLPAINAPTDYLYGVNIVFMNNQVYYGSQPVGTAAEYYQQALSLAQSQPATTISEQWRPLGVFALVAPNSSTPVAEFQLAVNKNGAIRGNYFDPLTNQVKPVIGAVDKKNMRAAWTVGQDKKVVYDTGLSNLLEAQGGILVHFSKDHTQQQAMVRLQKG